MKKITKIITTFSAIAFIFSIISSAYLASPSRKNKSDLIAKIGNSKLTKSEYNKHYQRELIYIQNTLGQALTEEQIKMLKIKQNVLQRLIWQHMLNDFIKKNNIKIDKSIAFEQIAKSPYFIGEDNKFSKENFQKILYANNMTESEYINEMSNNMLKGIIIESLMSHKSKTNEALNDLISYRYEAKKINMIKVKTTNDQSYKPSEVEISDFFDKNKADFHTPEYRLVEYIEITTNNIDLESPVNAEDVDAEFKKNIDTYSNYSQKDITNVLFQNQNDMEYYTGKYKNYAANFDKFINALDNKNVIISKLNNVNPEDLPEPLNYKVNEMKEGEVSQVIQSSIGWHIIKIEKITPLNDSIISGIKEEIKEEITTKRKLDKMYEMINNIENNIFVTKNISQIANEYNLPLKKSHRLIKNNKKQYIDMGIKKIDEFEQGVINKIFEMQLNEVIATNSDNEDNKHMFIKLIDIQKPAQQDINTARNKIITILTNKHNKSIAQQIAKELRNNIIKNNLQTKSINENDNIITKTNETIYRTEVAKHINPTQHYSEELIKEIFSNTKDQVTLVHEYEDDYIFCIIKESNKDEANNPISIKNTVTQFNDILNLLIQDDLYNYMQSNSKITIYNTPFNDKPNN